MGALPGDSVFVVGNGVGRGSPVERCVEDSAGVGRRLGESAYNFLGLAFASVAVSVVALLAPASNRQTSWLKRLASDVQ